MLLYNLFKFLKLNYIRIFHWKQLFSEQECSSRWTGLRDYFTKARRQKMQNKQVSFELFENMLFLEPFIKKSNR